MSTLGLAGRLAARRLLRDRTRTGLVVGLVATAVATLTVFVGEALTRAYPGSTVGRTGRGDVVGPFAVAVVVVVIVAGMAGDDRRRLRDVALLDLNGARPRQRRLAALAEGLLLGAAGTTIGTVIGVIAQSLLVAGRAGDVQRKDVLSAAAVGLVATMLAAVAGSFRSRRLPSRARLVGRRRSPPVRAWTVVLAVVSVAAGTWLASLSRSWFDMSILVPAGGAAVAAGTAWLASASLSLLGPVARRTSGTLHLATSGLDRNRSRSGPVAALVVVVCGVAMVGAIMGRSFSAREEARQEALGDDPRPERLNPDQVLVSPGFLLPDSVSPYLLAEIRSALPAGTVEAPRTLATYEAGGGPGIVVDARFPDDVAFPAGPSSVGFGDPAVLDAFGLDAAFAKDLADGRAVVLNPKLVADGVVRLTGPRRSSTVPAVLAPVGRAARRLPGVLVSATVADRFGLEPMDGGVLFRTPGPVPADLASSLEAKSRMQGDDAVSVMVGDDEVLGTGLFSSGPLNDVSGDGPYGGGPLDDAPLVPADEGDVRGLAAAGMVAGVAVIVIAIALTTVDRRTDDELLVVLGAESGLRRRLGGVQAALVAITSAALAVGVGTVAVAVGFARYNAADSGPPIPFVFPWDVALALGLGLPLVAALLTALFTPTIHTVDLRRLGE